MIKFKINKINSEYGFIRIDKVIGYNKPYGIFNKNGFVIKSVNSKELKNLIKEGKI